MKKKKDIFVKSSVHAWNPKPDKEQLKDWAKMLGKTLKNKNIITIMSLSTTHNAINKLIFLSIFILLLLHIQT